MKIKNNQSKNNQGNFKSKNKMRKDIKYGSPALFKNNTSNNNFNSAKKNPPKFPTPGIVNKKKNFISKEAPVNKKATLEFSKKLQTQKKGSPFQHNFSEDDSDESDVSSADNALDMIQFSAEEKEESDLEGEANEEESDSGSEEESDSKVEEDESDLESGEESDLEDEGESDSDKEGELDSNNDEIESNLEDEEQSGEDEEESDDEESDTDIEEDGVYKKKKKGSGELKTKEQVKKNQKTVVTASKIEQKPQNKLKKNEENKQTKAKNVEESQQKQVKKAKAGKQMEVGKTEESSVDKFKTTPTKKTSLLENSSNEFVAVIRNVPSSMPSDDIISALSTHIPAGNVLSVRVQPTKRRKTVATAIISLADNNSLQSILSKEYDINGQKFVVSEQVNFAEKYQVSNPEHPKAFIPRVPLSVSDEGLKKALELYVGSGKILEIQTRPIKNVNDVRNLLITFTDLESYDKALKRSFFTVNNVALILREAFESKINVPIYRAVYNEVPEGTTSSVLKAAIESTVGKGSVLSLHFSAKNNSLVFVTFGDEGSQSKAIANATPVQIDSTTLSVQAFIPRTLQKRTFKRNNEGGQQRPWKKMRRDDNTELSDQNNQTRSTPQGKNKLFKKKVATPGGPQGKQTAETSPGNKQSSPFGIKNKTFPNQQTQGAGFQKKKNFGQNANVTPDDDGRANNQNQFKKFANKPKNNFGKKFNKYKKEN